MRGSKMGQQSSDYLEIITAGGGWQQTLEWRVRHELMQEWRQVYAAALHAATGKWAQPDYEWHVFSFGYARALDGEKAAAAYESLERPPAFIVCPEEDDDGPAFRVTGGKLPNLRATGMDVYRWPEDLAWTMAYTHEDGYFGPYFSRRVWLGGQP